MSSMNARASRLRAEGMTVGYGHDVVLPGLDFQVPDGELTVILGPNACGKSTLLKSLSRVLTPSAGKIFLDDVAMEKNRTKDIARVLAMLPQIPEAPSGGERRRRRRSRTLPASVPIARVERRRRTRVC